MHTHPPHKIALFDTSTPQRSKVSGVPGLLSLRDTLTVSRTICLSSDLLRPQWAPAPHSGSVHIRVYRSTSQRSVAAGAPRPQRPRPTNWWRPILAATRKRRVGAVTAHRSHNGARATGTADKCGAFARVGPPTRCLGTLHGAEVNEPGPALSPVDVARVTRHWVILGWRCARIMPTPSCTLDRRAPLVRTSTYTLP